ncbi:MAG: hypothetical protein H7346_21125 [Burkholderiaceae bacterium]|nr:hypothetical protein [Burkholderiaceae bacterium]
MNKLFFTIAALAFSIAATTVQAATVHFDSGSAKVKDAREMRHKHKVWVPAHRSHGRLVRGHYVWR